MENISPNSVNRGGIEDKLPKNDGWAALKDWKSWIPLYGILHVERKYCPTFNEKLRNTFLAQTAAMMVSHIPIVMYNISLLTGVLYLQAILGQPQL